MPSAETEVLFIASNSFAAAGTISLKTHPTAAGNGLQITYEMPFPIAAPLSIAMYDLLGREKWEYSNHAVQAGMHTLQLGTANLAPGTYLVLMKTVFMQASAKALIEK